MRVASMKPNELAIVDGEELVLIGEILALKGFLSQRASMIDFIAQYDSVKNILRNVVSTAKRVFADWRNSPSIQRFGSHHAVARRFDLNGQSRLAGVSTQAGRRGKAQG